MIKTDFFSQGLNYSACNEDAYSEYRSFNFKGHEKVCCILGGGERFFNLICYETHPTSVCLVDQNKEQIYLFELKYLAYQYLNYNEFLGFLGLCKDAPQNRLKYYQKLVTYLSEESRNYWTTKLSSIRQGIIYKGKFEKFLGILSIIITLAFGKKSRIFFLLLHSMNKRDSFKIKFMDYDGKF